MSLNQRAMAGYLITKGLEREAAHNLAASRGENGWGDSFSSLIEQNRPLIGKQAAMELAACSMLSVKGLSVYPLDRVQGLLAVLTSNYPSSVSLDAVLQREDYFESEKIKDMLSEPGVRETLEMQFTKSRNKKKGLWGIFG